MKKTLLLLTCLLGKCVSAQYFQHMYGNTGPDERNAQFVPASDASQGYVMAGNSNSTDLHIVRTDNTGGFVATTPYFNNTYSISDPTSGLQWNSWATSIAEINAGGGTYEYIIAGETMNPTSSLPELLIMRIDASGNVLYVKSFTLNGGYYLKQPKLKMAQNGADVLVTGLCHTGGLADVFVFSIIANTGVANWGFAYDIVNSSGVSQNDFGKDIIENPYTSSEIIVVGSSSNDGLFMKINATTGASISATLYNITSFQELVSIKTSANPLVTTNDAFIVSGNLNSGSADVWTMLVNQAGTVTWSTNHDSNNSGVQNTNNEIMERYNTSGTYEYYAVGSIWQTSTDNDVQVLKLDNNGQLVTGGEFWYGAAGTQEAGMSIGFSNTGGFTVSGHASNAAFTNDQLLINAYFNGFTACNYTTNTFTSGTNTPSTPTCTIKDNSSPSDYTLTYSSNTVSNNNICFATSVGGGSNARSAHIPKANQFSFDFVANGQSNLNSGKPIILKIENNRSANLKAYMIDMIGRKYACKIIYTGSGNNWELSVSEPTSQGLYYIILTDGTELSTKSYLVR